MTMENESEANKRPRTDAEGKSRQDATVLSSFVFEKCLRESDVTKTVVLLGHFSDKERQAIVTLNRRHLPSSEKECMELVSSMRTDEVFNNDIYTKYAGAPSEKYSLINVDVIHPCTEKDISKYSQQRSYFVDETCDMYKAVTKAHIASVPPERIAWVYNMLEKKKEADRLIFEDPDPETGFVLHPDLKWDQSQKEKLYCIAIVHKRDLKSLRDLRAAHIGLLKNVLDKGRTAIKDKYEVGPESLRVLIHYVPSFYHLHVHFMHVGMEPGFGMVAGRAHMLADVISNLEICDEFYDKATLACSFGERDPLYKKFLDHASASKE